MPENADIFVRLPDSRRFAVVAASALCALICSACAGGDSPQVPSQSAGLNCVDDSPQCVTHRKTKLQAMVSDPARAWVKEPVTANGYASGVRLFAFKNKKKDLSCEELSHGRKEAEAAPAALRANGTGLTPAQIARSAMLAQEVGRELGNEYNRRCKKS
jgi:hypothetical protein